MEGLGDAQRVVERGQVVPDVAAGETEEAEAVQVAERQREREVEAGEDQQRASERGEAQSWFPRWAYEPGVASRRGMRPSWRALWAAISSPRSTVPATTARGRPVR